MKNIEKIKQIYELFKFGDVRCYVELDRLKNNFEIDDDELLFEIKAESIQPMKEMAEKLIADEQKDLIGDDDFVGNKKYLKEEIKTIIYVKNRFGKKDSHMAIRLDEDGEIAAITCRSTTQDQRKYAKKLVEKWLKKEFGSLSA